MELKVNFTNLDPSPAVESVIAEKAVKLKKYFEGKFHVQWNCTVEKGTHHSNVTLHGAHFDINAHASDDNLYKTIDHVLEKLEKQLLKKKETVTNKHHEKVINRA